MPDDSNGIYNVPIGTLVNSGDTVLPSQHNPWANDSASAISNRFSKDGRAPATGNWNLNTFRITNLGTPTASADATTKGYVDGLAFYTPQTLDASQQAAARKNIGVALTTGQCRLALSGGNLVLSRHNGIFIPIDGVAETIPSGGVSLAATGLTPATLYYIYAYMNTGTMTLEASATVPTADATTGIQIKTGDDTRSLVGMARPVTGPAWVDSATQCFVLSYYNRVRKVIKNGFTISRSTTSTSFVEVNAEIRTEFLSWGDSASYFNTDGVFYNSTTGGAVTARISLDGTSEILAETLSALQSGYTTPLPLAAPRVVSAGYHYATIAAKTSSGVAQFPGASGDAGIHIFVTTDG